MLLTFLGGFLLTLLADQVSLIFALAGVKSHQLHHHHHHHHPVIAGVNVVPTSTCNEVPANKLPGDQAIMALEIGDLKDIKEVTKPNSSSSTKYFIQSIIMELSIAFHSIIIGTQIYSL
jgi:hypothetical protein